MKKRDITKEEADKMFLLIRNGYSNRQISLELGVKDSMVFVWKKRLREQGIEVPCIVGRPKKPLIARLADFNRID